VVWTVGEARSRGVVDGVIMYACIVSACLASILVTTLVVACRRRWAQSRDVTSARAVSSNHRLQQRLQPSFDKHRLSAFDAYVLCCTGPPVQLLQALILVIQHAYNSRVITSLAVISVLSD